MPPSWEDKTVEKLKPKDSREKALARLFRCEHYSEELRQFSFQEAIMNWPEAKTCRYAMSALLSCALDPKSLLYSQAHDWISEHDSRGSILLAIALHEASFSEARRISIWKELFDRHDIPFNIGYEVLWRKSRDRFIRWDEVSPGLPLTPWYGFPPKDRPELYDSLARALENPEPDLLLGQTRSLIDDHGLGEMPYLRSQMINAVTESTDPEKVIEIIRPKAELFADEITDFLMEAQAPYWSDRDTDKRKLQFVQGIFGLAKILKGVLPQLDPGKATVLANNLVNASEKPWVWPMAEEICRYADNPKDVACFLESWVSHRSGDLNLSGQAKTEIDLLLAEMEVELDRLLRELPAPLATAYATIVSDHADSDKHWEPIVGLMKRYQTEFQQVFSGYVREGKVRLEFLLRYVEALGEVAKDDLQGWLRTNPVSYYVNPDQIAKLLDYITQFDLSAGNFVPKHTKELVGHYDLRTEDVDSPERVVALLPTEPGALTRTYLPAVFWGYAQWREMVLCSGYETVGALKSFFTSAAHNKWSPEKIKETLISLCEEIPQLREALCLVAWDKDFPAAGLAQGLLAQDVHRYRGWMSPTDWERMREWCLSHIRFLFPTHQTVVNTLLSLEDQRKLLFDSLPYRVGQGIQRPLDLPNPEAWAHLFDDLGAQARLLQWLKVHRGGIDVNDWLKWIGHYGFRTDPEVRKRVHELLDHRWEAIRILALKILRA